jgi:hypothetical protein
VYTGFWRSVIGLGVVSSDLQSMETLRQGSGRFGIRVRAWVWVWTGMNWGTSLSSLLCIMIAREHAQRVISAQQLVVSDATVNRMEFSMFNPIRSRYDTICDSSLFKCSCHRTAVQKRA